MPERGSHRHRPGWALKPSGAPDVRGFARFVTALGRRYSGRFHPGPGGGAHGLTGGKPR